MDHEEGEVSNYRGDVKGYDQDGQVETKKVLVNEYNLI